MSNNLLDTLVLKRVTPGETLEAVGNIAGHAVRTPLVRLNYQRPDAPNLEIYLKLETLQPINSFKVRGAVNKIQQANNNKNNNNLNDGTTSICIVSASAGNMGQGVAYAAKSLGYNECIVIVPDHAPQTKLRAMEQNYGATIIKVPFARWWEILMTGNASLELQGKEQQHLFVHPVCDAAVVAGNSTLGLEILQDLPTVDAVFCAWGGGGCSTGIGSVLKNAMEQPGCYHPYDIARDENKSIDMISVEPATAAPLCFSFNKNKTLTPLPLEQDDANAYQPSWIDGCGGKSVLKPMWELAQDVLTGAYKVELEAVERALHTLVTKNRIVAEGAGACPVAAAMFGPIKPHWNKVVAVVGGGCLDTSVLRRILKRDFDTITPYYTPAPGFSFTQPIQVVDDPKESPIKDGDMTTTMTTTMTVPTTTPKIVLSPVKVRELLPMNKCIQAVEQALISFANGTGGMPLRQVVNMPFPVVDDVLQQKIGLLACMPSYTTNNNDSVSATMTSNGDYAACKCISVFPQNSQTNGEFSSHQGVVLLWNKSGHGELLLIADAHQVTKIRTAAASAVATRTILGPKRCNNATIVSILGTGDQARSHAEAMKAILPNLQIIKIWGRDQAKVDKLRDNLQSQHSESTTVSVHDSVADCIENADIICTVTSARTPILTGQHVPLLKPGCHINAVGACQPQFHELSPELYQASIQMKKKKKIFTDSVDACLSEPGEVLAYLKVAGPNASSNFVGIGQVLAENEKLPDDVDNQGFSIFKSLGIALEDLFAAKLIYESINKT